MEDRACNVFGATFRSKPLALIWVYETLTDWLTLYHKNHHPLYRKKRFIAKQLKIQHERSVDRRKLSFSQQRTDGGDRSL